MYKCDRGTEEKPRRSASRLFYFFSFPKKKIATPHQESFRHASTLRKKNGRDIISHSNTMDGLLAFCTPYQTPITFDPFKRTASTRQTRKSSQSTAFSVSSTKTSSLRTWFELFRVLSSCSLRSWRVDELTVRRSWELGPEVGIRVVSTRCQAVLRSRRRIQNLSIAIVRIWNNLLLFFSENIKN